MFTLTGIDVKGDLDLGNALGCRGDANQVEVPKKLVVPDELTFTLVDLDFDSGLSVGGSRKHLRLLCRDGGIAGYELGHDSTESFNT